MEIGPLDFKDHGTARGIVRRAFETARQQSDRKTEVARIQDAIGSRGSLYNPKGRHRISLRLQREFGKTGIALTSGEEKSAHPGVMMSYYSSNGEGGFDICIARVDAVRGGTDILCYTVASLSQHAALRFVQRSDEPRDFEALIAAATRAATMIGNAANSEALKDLDADAVILVPAGGGLAAIAHAKSRVILTFVRVDKLGPMRSEVFEGMEPDTFLEGYFSLLVYRVDLLSPVQLEKIARSADVLRRTKAFANELPDPFSSA